MKVLSLLQPWATLVVLGHKTIETRSWNTSYRGELLIHASSGKRGGILAQEAPFTKYIPDFKSLPFGAIIGKVNLVEIVPVDGLLYPMEDINSLSLEERAFGNYESGRYAWIFEEAQQLLSPLPSRGSLRLWEIEIEEDFS